MNLSPHSSDIAVNSKADQDELTAKTGEEKLEPTDDYTHVRLASFVLSLMLCMFLISLDNVSHGAGTAIGRFANHIPCRLSLVPLSPKSRTNFTT
jgi:hypothetical protein